MIGGHALELDCVFQDHEALGGKEIGDFLQERIGLGIDQGRIGIERIGNRRKKLDRYLFNRYSYWGLGV